MPILIFDESPQIADRLADLISETKQDIKIYKTIIEKEAESLLEKTNPEAVLLDLNFFGNRAFKILEKIKRTNNKTVVIVMYTFHNEQWLKKCTELGADFLFDKYADFEKIPAVIKTVLDKKKLKLVP